MDKIQKEASKPEQAESPSNSQAGGKYAKDY
jgi:hypothetical protein